MSDGELPILASNAFTKRGAALSSAANIDQFEPPTSSTDSSNSMEIQSKKPTKIDTTIHKLGMFSKFSDTSLLHNTKGARIDKKQVVASMIWRSGKLFAKKAKTIAVFEHNAVKKLGKGNFGIVYQGK
ncbi:hypothetical protein BGZ80_009909 [Entomortierella chlamydospora]|uniref:Uncharacterized protein n=1 Tax=Entomortierella chlamydospora TaxID=101097 RepID=A0A9P6T0R9_9FUNG|nr:hypothetical protein BGZ79_010515 [Entomortierella chlamydospora]KAG0015338.1 hypothetical protein BGZ80_009909 [Entomortierella chlamydospora]